MRSPEPTGRTIRTVWLPAVLVFGLSTGAQAGTTGRISGQVVDENRQPLPGVTVQVQEAPLGAFVGPDGEFRILNVPAGKYSLKFSLLGYRSVLLEEVVVSADRITPVAVTLTSAPVEMDEIAVTAQRPVIDVNLTSSVSTVTRDEILNLPVQELGDIVNLQAGVVDGHFRGGRLGEVQYQVDGITVNNVFNNASSLVLDRSLLEEVQVISGTFDAEYGQAMSGVVNAVLRRGDDRLTWSGEVYAGGHLYSEGDRLQSFDLRPASRQNYQLTLSGPTPIANTVFLLSGRRFLADGSVLGERRFEPGDRRDSTGALRPSGSGDAEPLGYSREWSGVAKLTSHPRVGMELSYQAIFNRLRGRRANYAFRLNPDGLSRQRTWSMVHGLDWTHALSPTTYYKLSARQNYFEYQDFVYEDLYDQRYDVAGSPFGDANFENGAITQGVEFTRFHQSTNSLVWGGSLVSQVNDDHLVKMGGEFQLPRLEFGNLGHLRFTQESGRETLVRYVDAPPDFPGLHIYHPVLGATYAQDEFQWENLRLRGGLRFEYFNARSSLPSDLANPANAIQGAPESKPVSTTAKHALMPRIGVSYPITESSAVFFAYGHFTQMPALGQVFSNADYSVLDELQAGGIDFGVLGNPDVKPERTVQYQFGYRRALSRALGVEGNVFYKDVRDLLGVEFISTYNDAEYARLTNVDFGNVVGVTVSLDQRPIGLFSATLDYTWQLAEGNSSDPRETATRASAGEDPRPRRVPLGWDQRHTLNATVSLARPGDFSASAIARVASGQPYTPILTTGFGGGLETNSGRKPAAALLDLRMEKHVSVSGMGISVFGRVFNAFDSRFFNGFVFASTGSPYYSRNPAADVNTLIDPTRFYEPRRIEVGISLRGDGGRP